MNLHSRETPVNRLEGLLRRRGSGAIAATSQMPRSARGSGFALLGPGAEYRYRRAGHELALGVGGVTRRHESAVGRGEAEFALAVVGPLLVLSYRFGAAIPWASADPYNWHFAPAADRPVPAAPRRGPDSSARAWTTLWITLVDADDGRARVGRAVALRPDFTRALRGALREQAMRPFRRAAADRALDRIRLATHPLDLGVRARTRCPGVWVPADGPRPVWAGRYDRFS